MDIQNIKKEIEESPNLKAFLDDIQTSDRIELMSGWDERQTDLVYYIHGRLHPQDMLWNKKINHLFSFIKTYDDELHDRLRKMNLIAIYFSDFRKIGNDTHCLRVQLIHQQISIYHEPEYV